MMILTEHKTERCLFIFKSTMNVSVVLAKMEEHVKMARETTRVSAPPSTWDDNVKVSSKFLVAFVRCLRVLRT